MVLALVVMEVKPTTPKLCGMKHSISGIQMGPVGMLICAPPFLGLSWNTCDLNYQNVVFSHVLQCAKLRINPSWCHYTHFADV